MTRPSMRRAIVAKCKDCSYDPANGGTWREQVGACGVECCPLYLLRPLPRGQRHPWYVAPGPRTEAQRAARERLAAGRERWLALRAKAGG